MVILKAMSEQSLARVRARERAELDETDYTAVQCDRCGFWTLHYWQVDEPAAGLVHNLCPKCDPRANPENGWPK